MLISLVAGALAIQLTARDVPCPFGEGTARRFEVLSNNAAGGYDSDLARYSSGDQFRAYAISTCTGSLYSVYGRDLDEAVPEARKAAVQAALDAAVARLADRQNPTTWERYRLAEAVYGALGKDEAFLGRLLVEASWVARDEVVGFYAGLEGPTEVRELLKLGWEELKKPLSPADRKKVLHNLARVAHRGGYPEERDAFLAAFEAVGGLTPREVEALGTFRYVARTVEPQLQELALQHLIAALRGELAHDEKVELTYLTAELNRRLGRKAEALPLFFLVANDQKADPFFRGLAAFFAEELAAELDPGTRRRR